MRRFPLGVALSTTAHALAVVWVGTHAFPTRAAVAPAATTPIEVVAPQRPEPPEAAPIDVAIVDEPIAPDERARAHERARLRARAAPSPRTADAARAEIEAAIEAATRATGPRRAGPETQPARPQDGALSMRRGQLPRPMLPSGRWDALDHVPRGTTPEKLPTSGRLRESGGGTFTSDQSGFTTKVHPDGSVTLRDARNLKVHLALPSPKDLGRALAGWYESDKGPWGTGGDTTMARQLKASAGPTTDGADPAKPEHHMKDTSTTVIVPLLGGSFDVTDWLMRSTGSDPYAAKKLAFLDATRDERVELGKRHRAKQRVRTPQIMLRNLEAMWASVSDPRARKQALFELWDECVETGDADTVAAGNAARRLVIGFIRGHVPAGSADAFTPDELAAFARTRRSKAAFQPYE